MSNCQSPNRVNYWLRLIFRGCSRLAYGLRLPGADFKLHALGEIKRGIMYYGWGSIVRGKHVVICAA